MYMLGGRSKCMIFIFNIFGLNIAGKMDHSVILPATASELANLYDLTHY